MLLGTSLPFLEGAQEVRRRYGIGTVMVREREQLPSGGFLVRVHLIADDVTNAEATGQVIDELGAGDAAAGAFLAATLRGETSEVVAEQVARVYARMLTIPGDSWVGSLADVTTKYRASRSLLR